MLLSHGSRSHAQPLLSTSVKCVSRQTPGLEESLLVGLVLNAICFLLNIYCLSDTRCGAWCRSVFAYPHVGYGDDENRGSSGTLGDTWPAIDLGTGRTAVEVTAGAASTDCLTYSIAVTEQGFSPTVLLLGSALEGLRQMANFQPCAKPKEGSQGVSLIMKSLHK
eukprot:6457961-Amphidinium_carterae.1